jgi:hypothetical protein
VLWAGSLEESPGTPHELAGARLAHGVEQQLRAYVRDHERCALVIRYHPNQYHLFNPVLDQPRVYVSNPSEEPIELIVRMADVAVVQASTVGVEAALMGKRVLALTWSPTVKFTGLDYAAMGYAEAVPSFDALLPTLAASPAERARIEGLQHGPAAPAVANVIIELAQRRGGVS